MKKALMVGDNCIDIYENINLYYLTGNVVDTGVNMAILKTDVAMLTNIAKDKYGDQMLNLFEKHNINIDRLRILDGQTAYTIMNLIDGERIHGDYVEGVLENMEFSKDDIDFALDYDLLFSAFWGKAEDFFIEIKKQNNAPLIAYDYADRHNDDKVDMLDGIVDIGFFSWEQNEEDAKAFLKNRTDKGMKIAVTTFGVDGSLAYDGNEYYRAYAVEVEEVVNTVGAGDSFIAGFLASYLNNESIEKSLENGSKLAAKIVSQFSPILNEESYPYKD